MADSWEGVAICPENRFAANYRAEYLAISFNRNVLPRCALPSNPLPRYFDREKRANLARALRCNLNAVPLFFLAEVILH